MDPIELSIFSSRIAAVCDEMGAVLRRTAFSPNIKDRLDYSCAVFDPHGELCAQAAHIPVHLGSMAYAMRNLVEAFDWSPGNMLILNDPFLGGTHLPDVTLIAPVFIADKLIGFVANRAHHADIGAHSPGSMPVSRSLAEEGMVIAPGFLLIGGRVVEPVLNRITAGTTRPSQARGDFAAQISANHTGVRRLSELAAGFGLGSYLDSVKLLNEYAERLAASSLAAIPDGTYAFEDVMDDDGQGQRGLRIHLAMQVSGHQIRLDFSRTAAQVPGNINCPLAVAAGNVETSSRVVDVVLGALAEALPGRIPAASQGSMNNIAMGGRGAAGKWDYYETLGGGMGGGPAAPGLSAVQTHMTNTLNTPVEVLEAADPVRVRRYAIRRNTGGNGWHRGGDGLLREFEFLTNAQVTLLTERREYAPWGLQGGAPGCRGENRLNGRLLPGKVSLQVKSGDRLSVATPGGGGWGRHGGNGS